MGPTGIYIIVNNQNGKAYIGSALDCNIRMSQHLYPLRKNAHTNKYLQAEWNEFGEANFEFRVVIFCKETHLRIWEQIAIDGYFSTYGRGCIYNGNLGAARPSKDARLKMSTLRRGSITLEETKQKISGSLKGREMPASERLKHVGNKSKTGQSTPEITKKKIAETKKRAALERVFQACILDL